MLITKELLSELLQHEITDIQIHGDDILYFWPHFWWFKKRARINQFKLVGICKAWVDKNGFNLIEEASIVKYVIDGQTWHAAETGGLKYLPKRLFYACDRLLAHSIK